MRYSMFLPALSLALLGGCQVTTDDANDAVAVTYNGDLAADAASDVGNVVGNVAEDIGNDVDREAAKVQNTDVDINVETHDSNSN